MARTGGPQTQLVIAILPWGIVKIPAYDFWDMHQYPVQRVLIGMINGGSLEQKIFTKIVLRPPPLIFIPASVRSNACQSSLDPMTIYRSSHTDKDFI